MNPSQYINQTSGKDEYYTPGLIVACARAVLDTIDLDPASSEDANAVVQAKRIFTRAQDGLKKKWAGRVWLNHPFGRIQNPLWIAKLLTSFNDGHVSEALCITYACTSESWFQPLLEYPQCFLCPRTNYYLPDGTLKRGVTKGSVVTYFGPNIDRFHRAFWQRGKIKELLIPF